jgi:putative flippase GtrA
VVVIRSHGLYQRFRLQIQEGFRFLVVGGFGAVITIVGAVALHSLGKYVAVTIVTVIGTVVTFLGNRYWAFRHRQGQGATQESAMFFVLNGIGLLIYYACIWVIQDLMRLEGRSWYAAALVLGTALGTVFRFWSYRKWVWTMRPQPGFASGGPAGYVEPAIAGGIAGRTGLIRGSASPRTPTGRHAAARRAPAARAPAVRNRPGAHRRS